MGHNTKNIIKNLVLIFSIWFVSCTPTQTNPLWKKHGKFTILTPLKEKITTYLAISMKEKNLGLSGIKKENFNKNEGLLFYYKSASTKLFWMPDTWFNLDLIFLSEKLEILNIERNLLAHPGRTTPPPIKRSTPFISHHVLEIRSDSLIAKKLKVGMKLKWIDSMTLSQRVLKIHPSQ